MDTLNKILLILNPIVFIAGYSLGSHDIMIIASMSYATVMVSAELNKANKTR